MRYALIEGYKHPYRISDEGVVESFGRGKWKALTPSLNGHRRATVSLLRMDGKKESAGVSRLMAAAFMGEVPKGYAVIHKNGAKLDNSLRNLEIVPQSKTSPGGPRKTVLKVDRWGVVVGVYRSSIEAAKKNYISVGAVRNRCHKRVADPYRLDGYNYLYET